MAERVAEAAHPLGEEKHYPGRVVRPYPPLRDYALIGDGHGAALVCRDGSIDWCCLGRFDAAPVAARLLDARRGGFLSLAPPEPAESRRHYLHDTAILATRFCAAGGEATVIDFMPMGCRPEAGAHDYTRINAPGWIVRILRGETGRLRFRAAYRPVRGFTGAPVALRAAGGLVTGTGVPALQGDARFEVVGEEACAEFTLGAGETRCFILSPAPLPPQALGDTARRLLRITTAFWREWIGYCRYDGPHAAAVRRSAITLKQLIYAPSGAMVAAPTTSLPEVLGGGRNWDYRFCWVRDACFALYALAALGFVGEARRFVEFLTTCHLERGLHLVYGVGGEVDLAEHEVPGFAGYRGSPPVRVGNAAHRQVQLDAYGELLDLALLYRQLGGHIGKANAAALADVADRVCARWHEPDNGIWEMRDQRRHFVYSKIMCWTAVDRAIRLFGPRPGWVEARRTIAETVLRDGIDPASGALIQAFGRPRADAALLTVPWLGFPVSDETFRRTVRLCLHELREGDYLRRYVAADGLGGTEGAFLIGSFWLADALLYLGAADEAGALLEALIDKGNDVGLFAEEIEPRSDAFLGNMPQALVHLALIHSALRQLIHRRQGPAALRGSNADRARRHVDAAAGLGAWITDVKQSLRLRRITASQESVLKLP